MVSPAASCTLRRSGRTRESVHGAVMTAASGCLDNAVLALFHGSATVATGGGGVSLPPTGRGVNSRRVGVRGDGATQGVHGFTSWATASSGAGPALHHTQSTGAALAKGKVAPQSATCGPSPEAVRLRHCGGTGNCEASGSGADTTEDSPEDGLASGVGVGPRGNGGNASSRRGERVAGAAESRAVLLGLGHGGKAKVSRRSVVRAARCVAPGERASLGGERGWR